MLRRSGPRNTLARAVERAGVGLHGGAAVRVRLAPAAPGTGVVFVRLDAGGVEMAARVAAVTGVERCVTLGVMAPPGETSSSPVMVSTVEHLLATLYALDIHDARIEVDAPELPALDGSAEGWVEAVREAGTVSAGGALLELTPEARIEIAGGAAVLEPLAPSDGPARLFLCVRHDPGRGLAAQELEREVTPSIFRSDVAPARTFCFADELDWLRGAGLARGGTLENAVVLDERGAPLNPGGLRFPDEPARHKMLDAIGDLSLLGARLHARVILRGAGHAAHVALVKRLAASM